VSFRGLPETGYMREKNEKRGGIPDTREKNNLRA